MRFRFSPRSKKLLVILGGLRIAFELIDWVVGKIGYMAVFTSPEDFQVMIERAPAWLKAIVDALEPVMLTLMSWLHAGWVAASGEAGTLVVLGMVMLLLIVDVERLTQAIRSLLFRARRTVSDQVWIAEESAISLMKGSDWGRLIGPYGVDTGVFNFDSVIARFHPRVDLSDVDKAHLKFRLFLKKVLAEFAEQNSTAHRTEDGREMYDEVALRKFLAQALDDVIAKEFGQPPSFKIT